MLGFNDIVKRLGAIWHIAFNDPARLQDLELTPKGFKESFWALPIAFLPVFLSDILIRPFGEFMQVLFIGVCVWIVPLMVVIALCDVLGIRNRIIPFVIAFNWLQAFWRLCTIVIMLFLFILPLQVLMLVLAIVSLFIFYRVFHVSLDKSAPYTIAFMVFYYVIVSVVLFIAVSMVGLSVEQIGLPPEMTGDVIQGRLL